ncbi:hypothetical protein Pcinc_025425 [Petrolisthes cinctipes]|uniref:Uncharacterized protein n=1 Tax=Petrolisthes cinctipes TaxID=88211 RepID=A0AAE1F8J6_PETCI|nr:hypothetical protein Pcinc_025425 [Petrolisthes cinctipes]
MRLLVVLTVVTGLVAGQGEPAAEKKAAAAVDATGGAGGAGGGAAGGGAAAADPPPADPAVEGRSSGGTRRNFFSGSPGFSGSNFQSGHNPAFQGGQHPVFQNGHNPAFQGGQHPVFQGGLNPSFPGSNVGFQSLNVGLGGFGGPVTGNCRRWCKTPTGADYCCESGTDPISPVALKPGFCPAIRPTCPRLYYLAPVTAAKNRSFLFHHLLAPSHQQVPSPSVSLPHHCSSPITSPPSQYSPIFTTAPPLPSSTQ